MLGRPRKVVPYSAARYLCTARPLAPPLEPRIAQSQSIRHRPTRILSSALSRSRNGTCSLFIGLRKLGQGLHVRPPSLGRTAHMDLWVGFWSPGTSSTFQALVLAKTRSGVSHNHPPPSTPIPWGGRCTESSHTVLFFWYLFLLNIERFHHGLRRHLVWFFEVGWILWVFVSSPISSDTPRVVSESMLRLPAHGSRVVLPLASVLPGPRHELPHEAPPASMSSGVFLLDIMFVWRRLICRSPSLLPSPMFQALIATKSLFPNSRLIPASSQSQVFEIEMPSLYNKGLYSGLITSVSPFLLIY